MKLGRQKQVWSQPSLHSKFQARKGHTGDPVLILKNKNKKDNRTLMEKKIRGGEEFPEPRGRKTDSTGQSGEDE